MKKKLSGNSTKAAPGSVKTSSASTPKSGRRTLVSADRYRPVENTLPTDRRALIRLMSIIGVCRDIQTPKERAKFLVNEFREFPKLIWYFRQAYDAAINFKFTSAMAATLSKEEAAAGGVWDIYTELRDILHDLRIGVLRGLHAKMAWRLFMEALPVELRPVACSVLDKELNCGITPEVLNRVLNHLGKTPVTPRPASVTARPGHMSIEITSSGGAADQYAVTAILWYAGERVGNIVFAVCPKLRPALAVLRAAGIELNVPNYINPQDITAKPNEK